MTLFIIARQLGKSKNRAFMKHSKILIVNADDFGMSRSISRGIMTSAKGGLVKATTVMTNAHDFSEMMVELLSSDVQLDVGFHVNLTWGQPELEPEEIPTLVDNEGMFLNKERLLLRAITRRLVTEEAYKEIYTQCKKLKKFVKDISHVDGHQHVQAFPVIRSAVERVAKEFNILYVRSPYESKWTPWYWGGLRRLVVKRLRASRSHYWQRRGFLTSDAFGGFGLGGGGHLLKRWYKALVSLPEGVTELMVHPGHISPRNDDYNIEREEEIKILTHSSIIETVHELGIELLSFREWIERRR